MVQRVLPDLQRIVFPCLPLSQTSAGKSQLFVNGLRLILSYIKSNKDFLRPRLKLFEKKSMGLRM